MIEICTIYERQEIVNKILDQVKNNKTKKHTLNSAYSAGIRYKQKLK